MLAGNLLLFFVVGFIQFYYVLNRNMGAQLFWIASLVGGIYFLGWWSLITWVAGTMMGSRLAFMQIAKDRIDNESDSEFNGEK